jgi:glycosyltransferase involved in cell wall biosynthesis
VNSELSVPSYDNGSLNTSMRISISISIIIAVYNDWTALDECLHSLSERADGRDFEVIVVDDGSDEIAPEAIRQWDRGLALSIVRQPHAGISAARNHGIETSKGSILLFVDADCRLQANCLTALERAIAASPQHTCFQLRLTGNCSGLAGRTEHLRLTTLQNQMLQPDGCMRYLNTAGFAIRRASVRIEKGLFDSVALRGEDTLLLANLMEAGELPFFVGDAVIQHEVAASLPMCLRKDMRSAYLEGGTYALIASRGIRIRMSHRERLSILWSMWKTSEISSIGRLAFFALIVRQLLSRITSVLYRLLHSGAGSPHTNIASLNVNL